MFTQRSLRKLISFLRRDEGLETDGDTPVRQKSENGMKLVSSLNSVLFWSGPFRTQFRSVPISARSLGFYHHQLADVSQEQALLKQRLDHLAQQEKILTVGLRQTQNAMAPINRLPLEVLSEILKATVRRHYTWDRILWKQPALRTCHIWRVILMSLPSVWSQVYVSGTTSLEEINVWVCRAKNLPLDVHLDFSITDDDDGAEIEEVPENVVSAWNLISARQISSLHISGGGDITALFPLAGNLAELQTLVLEWYSEREDPVPTLTIFHSQIPHNLRTLKIDTDITPCSFLLCPAPPYDLSHLEKLRLVGDATLLHPNEALITCRSLRLLEWNTWEPPEEPCIVLPNVGHIVIGGHDLLESFELPKLHTLELTIVEDDVCQYLRRLKGLQKLVIGIPESLVDIPNFLASIAHIVHLKFGVVGRAKHILKALSSFTPGTTPGTFHTPCPNLRVLECTREEDIVWLKPLLDRHVLLPLNMPPLEIWVQRCSRPKGELWEEWMGKIHWGDYPSPDD